jgi:hypothetical protein
MIWGRERDRWPGLPTWEAGVRGMRMSRSPWIAAAAAVALMALPAAAQTGDGDGSVPVRLTVDRQWYEPGDHGRVWVRLSSDAYLIVLHAEPDGHVRIVFPLDPPDNAYVHRDSTIEIRSRGDRDAFVVDDSSGSGTWYAAVSKKPYHFDPVTLSTHWDYGQIPHVLAVRDAEGDLTALVQRLVTDRFDYDIVQYHIGLDRGRRVVAAAPGGSGGAAPTPPPSSPPDDPDGPWWLGPWGLGPWGWPGWGLPRPSPNPGPLYNRVAPLPAGASGAGHTAEAPEAHAAPEAHPDAHHEHGSGGGGSSPHH